MTLFPSMSVSVRKELIMKDSPLLNHYPKLKKDKIDHHLDECQCDYCGFPMYYGETIYISEDLGKVFCGNYCYKITLQL